MAEVPGFYFRLRRFGGDVGNVRGGMLAVALLLWFGGDKRRRQVARKGAPCA